MGSVGWSRLALDGVLLIAALVHSVQHNYEHNYKEINQMYQQFCDCISSRISIHALFVKANSCTHFFFLYLCLFARRQAFLLWYWWYKYNRYQKYQILIHNNYVYLLRQSHSWKVECTIQKKIIYMKWYTEIINIHSHSILFCNKNPLRD